MHATEHVVLLHGLTRSSASMKTLAKALRAEGYSVDNVDYPSRTSAVRELARETLSEALASDEARKANRIHFVTHSMGGILVRAYLGSDSIERLGRVVMLAPPNAGSEVVDALRNWTLFKRLNGPAGQELGTDPESSVNQLGPVNFELGVIAGDRSINWINSLMMIPGRDDGKVSVERTRVEGMTDHIVIHATHPFMMKNKAAIALTIRFLKTGRFADPDSSDRAD